MERFKTEWPSGAHCSGGSQTEAMEPGSARSVDEEGVGKYEGAEQRCGSAPPARTVAHRTTPVSPRNTLAPGRRATRLRLRLGPEESARATVGGNDPARADYLSGTLSCSIWRQFGWLDFPSCAAGTLWVSDPASRSFWAPLPSQCRDVHCRSIAARIFAAYVGIWSETPDDARPPPRRSERDLRSLVLDATDFCLFRGAYRSGQAGLV